METTQTHELHTVGKDGKTYKFVVEQDAPDHKRIHSFRVKTDKDSSHYFDFEVIEIPGPAVKVVAMHNNADEYKGKGIPEAMIRSVSKWMGRTIFSSSNSKLVRQPGEYRTDPASAAWKRLVATGEAIYIKEVDMYTYMNRE